MTSQAAAEKMWEKGFHHDLFVSNYDPELKKDRLKQIEELITLKGLTDIYQFINLDLSDYSDIYSIF